MGSQQQFCLRWNNHQSNMLSVFDDLFQNEALVDVTLACDGLSIKAHKMVLSACSPYFQNLFLDNPCKHPIVILKDIRFTDLKALMDFMYKGEVNVSQEQLSTLLRTAETLKVRGLTEVAAGGNGTAEMNNSLLPQTSSSTQGNQNVLPVQLPRPPNGTNTTTTPSQPPVSTATNNIQHQQPIQIPPPSNRSTCSPSPKRKRVRHWHKPDAGSSASDYEDSGDSRGHELIEPKVEITEELPDGEEPPAKSDTGGGKSGSGGRNATTSTATNASGAMDCSSGGGGGSGAGGSKSNTQGVPSSHEASPVNDSQNSLARSSSINTTPVIFGQQPPSLAQTIGQPPVLQGTSQALPGLPLLMTTSTMVNVTNAGPGTSRQDSVFRRIPERLRPRPCKICNKIISNASNMIKHMLVHNPVKIPFRCNLCDCKYSREETLRWHLKVKHGIIRPALGRDSYLQEITIDAVSSATSSWMSTT